MNTNKKKINKSEQNGLDVTGKSLGQTLSLRAQQADLHGSREIEIRAEAEACRRRLSSRREGEKETEEIKSFLFKYVKPSLQVQRLCASKPSPFFLIFFFNRLRIN